MSNLNRINSQISQTSLQLLANTILFGKSSYSDKTNTHIFNATIDYIQLTKRFNEPFFFFWIMRFFLFSFIFLTTLPIFTVTSSSIIFFGLPLNFTLFNRDLNRRCLVYVFSLHFSGNKFLVNLWRQFRVRKIFSCTQNFLFTRFCGNFSFCV